MFSGQINDRSMQFLEFCMFLISYSGIFMGNLCVFQAKSVKISVSKKILYTRQLPDTTSRNTCNEKVFVKFISKMWRNW